MWLEGRQRVMRVGVSGPHGALWAWEDCGVCLFLRFYLFLDRGEGREKERETLMCGCLSSAPYWGPGLQPRNVP